MAVDDRGIERGYEDALGRWRDTPEDTRARIVATMEANSTGSGDAPGDVLIVTHGERARVPASELALED
ncbi:MAG: hypothetical protein LC804_12730, partial [Acidobacteria bacterium]|nr:hypothetical protein [Acidobacteriota bacterium]